jgi:hypothetical protein
MVKRNNSGIRSIPICALLDESRPQSQEANTLAIQMTETGVPRWSRPRVALPSLALARQLANFIEIGKGKEAPNDYAHSGSRAQLFGATSRASNPGCNLEHRRDRFGPAARDR